MLSSWTGRNVHIDRAPILDEVPDMPGFFAAVTSDGYTLGPIARRMIADAVLGLQQPDQAFAAARFGD